MSLRYSGQANLSEANITVYGDGTSKSVTVDLSKNPFALNFANNPPSYAIIVNPDDNPGITSQLNGNNLTLTFEDPPPFVDPLHPTPGGRGLVIKFFYG